MDDITSNIQKAHRDIKNNISSAFLSKAQYTKRTGTPGNYKYTYPEEQEKYKHIEISNTVKKVEIEGKVFYDVDIQHISGPSIGKEFKSIRVTEADYKLIPKKPKHPKHNKK